MSWLSLKSDSERVGSGSDGNEPSDARLGESGGGKSDNRADDSPGGGGGGLSLLGGGGM